MKQRISYLVLRELCVGTFVGAVMVKFKRYARRDRPLMGKANIRNGLYCFIMFLANAIINKVGISIKIIV